jgi:hypothetical protein
MKPIEGHPGWNKFIHPFTIALQRAFGCRHSHLSRVFTLEGKSYKVCCDCGTHLDYSLDEMSLRTAPPRARD